LILAPRSVFESRLRGTDFAAEAVSLRLPSRARPEPRRWVCSCERPGQQSAGGGGAGHSRGVGSEEREGPSRRLIARGLAGVGWDLGFLFGFGLAIRGHAIGPRSGGGVELAKIRSPPGTERPCNGLVRRRWLGRGGAERRDVDELLFASGRHGAPLRQPRSLQSFFVSRARDNRGGNGGGRF